MVLLVKIYIFICLIIDVLDSIHLHFLMVVMDTEISSQINFKLFYAIINNSILIFASTEEIKSAQLLKEPDFVNEMLFYLLPTDRLIFCRLR